MQNEEKLTYVKRAEKTKVPPEEEKEYILYSNKSGKIATKICTKNEIDLSDYEIIAKRTPKKNCRKCHGIGRDSFYYITEIPTEESKRLKPCKCLKK